MLNRIVIENYRSCLHTVIDLQPRLSVLIGPNSSGKTNILQGIMLLNKLAEGKEHGSSASSDTARVRSRIRATFTEGRALARFMASLAVYPDDSNNDVVLDARQRWALRDGKKRASVEVPLAFRRVQRHTSRWDYMYMRRPHAWFAHQSDLPNWGWNCISQVSDYCRRIRYYGASQFTNPANCPASFEIEQEGQARLRAPTRLRGHAKILFDMYSAEKQRDNRRYAQFLEIVGPKGLRLIDSIAFKVVPTSSTDYSVRVGGRVEIRKRNKLLVIPQFRIGRQKLSPNQLSEGTFKTLALLFHVITEEGALLLVEEPEVCVHHGLLASILELIKSYSRQKQMILSTHSDYVLDHVKPENVYSVSLAKSEGTIVRHIPKSMTSKELAALRRYLEREGNLGEYWREGGFGDRP
jgi:ABC-type branched-subunit amino acid transport system ATPase component